MSSGRWSLFAIQLRWRWMIAWLAWSPLISNSSSASRKRGAEAATRPDLA